MKDKNVPSSSDTSKISAPAAWLALILTTITLLLLVSLYILSPEFNPSWSMVSEYAYGHYGWVLSLMFLAWGVSTWALAGVIWSQVTTKAGKVGLWLLLVVGLGEAMASVFDITHDVGHSIAGVLGNGNDFYAQIGRSGGSVSGGNFAKDRDRARAAGKKGGKGRGKNKAA